LDPDPLVRGADLWMRIQIRSASKRHGSPTLVIFLPKCSCMIQFKPQLISLKLFNYKSVLHREAIFSLGKFFRTLSLKFEWKQQKIFARTLAARTIKKSEYIFRLYQHSKIFHLSFLASVV